MTLVSISDKMEPASPRSSEFRTVEVQAADVVDVLILVNGNEAGRLGPFTAAPSKGHGSKAQVRLRVING
jgi:hypothetical protein